MYEEDILGTALQHVSARRTGPSYEVPPRLEELASTGLLPGSIAADGKRKHMHGALVTGPRHYCYGVTYRTVGSVLADTR